MKTNHLRNSPCQGCKRVACPENCDSKDCNLWRRWFIDRWNYLCGAASAAGRFVTDAKQDGSSAIVLGNGVR